MNENSEDMRSGVLKLSKFSVLAVFFNFILDVSIGFTRFLSYMSEMLISHAALVEERKSFHEDVARTIETITEGE